MQLLKLAAAVLNQTPLDWEGNRRRIATAIGMAREAGASVLCLPELCITGYNCEDAFHAPGVQATARQMLLELLNETRGMVVSCGLPVAYQHGLFNVACLIVDAQIVGFVAKRFLAGDGIHYEPRWFKPWPAGRRGELTWDDSRFPIGDIHFNVGGIKLGFEICEDAWVANRPGADLARAGVDIILNPSASHFAFGKHDVRRRFVLEGSRAFNVSYVYSNLLGNEAGRAIYDGGAIIASGGSLIAAGPRFSFDDVLVTVAQVDVAETRMKQSRTGSFEPDLALDPACVCVPFEFPVEELTAQHGALASWETSGQLKEEEFSRAIALGLFDYLRKSRSQGFIVSLSGGADSSAISCLVAILVSLGYDELGRARFLDKLNYITRIATAPSKSEIVRGLLTCVYQSTRNSTATTREAARSVAEAIGAEFLEFDVDCLVQEYIRMVSQAVGRSLDWEHDDLALQNIQARVRSPGVWMLANLRGALLVSTSNRSEAAVGYATMDGDTSGGLSPIAGIDKAYLRRWLSWLETRGPTGVGPIPALAAVNRQAPTAELRPQGASQTDEADLMPYDILDAVERLAIRDKLMPLEVFQHVVVDFPHHVPHQLARWVERFFRLWCRNQWKRERYAPSFHVDDENLDPKTWCRFPILSGGFEYELDALRRYTASKYPAI